jgi:chemotaxis protein methyltransferase CheR
MSLTPQERLRLRDLITSYSGLGESLQGDQALERAIAQRLRAHSLVALADYWSLLERQPNGEMNSLVQLLTNKETFFFREMHQFEVLRDRILPELMSTRRLRTHLRHEGGARPPVRLWSAGCATGEEPYSLAITLLEFEARHGPLEAEVIATDIDADALETARQGRYGERALRLVPAAWRQRYFAFDGRTYHIAPEVAHRVSFRVHNLAEDCCPPGMSNLDVIFCRNVTIYFDAQARQRLNARLADSLREGGYLFVASAETMGHNQGRLELLSLGKTFLFRKGRSSGQQMLAASAAAPLVRPLNLLDDLGPPALQRPDRLSTPEPSRREPIPAPSTTASVLARAQLAFKLQDYEAALRELDRLPAGPPLELEACALRAAILVQTERLEEAEETCQVVLAHDPWRADAHFLMGVIQFYKVQPQQAIQALKTAVYLQPEHQAAHFYLAETYNSLGLLEQAKREYKNTLNILSHRPVGNKKINLSGLEDDILRQACETNLAKLQQYTRLKLSGGNRA